MADSITLYRDGPSAGGRLFWRTDVHRRENGDIAVCSGDGDREWYFIVAAADVDALRAALLREMSAADDDREQNVLKLLARRFAGDENPYDEIGRFLAAEQVPHRNDVW